jgi:integrase/recombinase XerD
MPVVDPCLIRSSTPSGVRMVCLGVPLLDGYLDFVAARARPNTVLATAYDLKVLFAVVGKSPAEVSSADVLAFMTAQRHGGSTMGPRVVDESTGEAAATSASTSSPGPASPCSRATPPRRRTPT